MENLIEELKRLNAGNDTAEEIIKNLEEEK